MDYEDLYEMFQDFLADYDQLQDDYDRLVAVGEARDVMLAAALESGAKMREDRRAANALAEFSWRFGKR